MTTPVIGVSALALNDDRILLIQRGKEPGMGKWSLPGGRLEFGEDLIAGVLRELREETGLEAIVDRFLGFREVIGDTPEPHHVVLMAFAVDVYDAIEPTAGDDAADARWYDLSDIPGVDLNDGLYEFLVGVNVIPDARAFSL